MGILYTMIEEGCNSMINKLTEQQVVDTFAKYCPRIELNLPLDSDHCLWLYYTLEELEQQVQRFPEPGTAHDKPKYDAWLWMDKVVRERKIAWLEHGNVSDVEYTEIPQ